MLLRLFWPKSDFFKQEAGGTIEDAFWVEATQEEAELEILPRLLPARLKLARQFATRSEVARWFGDPPRPFCALVNRSLSHVYPMQVHFPMHNLWNAYSPFGEFEPVHLDRLEDLQRFVIPAKVMWLGI